MDSSPAEWESDDSVTMPNGLRERERIRIDQRPRAGYRCRLLRAGTQSRRRDSGGPSRTGVERCHRRLYVRGTGERAARNCLDDGVAALRLGRCHGDLPAAMVDPSAGAGYRHDCRSTGRSGRAAGIARTLRGDGSVEGRLNS
jgi:hypothetical protein